MIPQEGLSSPLIGSSAAIGINRDLQDPVIRRIVRGKREFAINALTGEIVAAPHVLDSRTRVFSPMETKVAVAMAMQPGVTLSTDQLGEAMYPGRGAFVSDRSIAIHIKRLRKKIDESDTTQPPTFEGVRGFGYRLTQPRLSRAELLQMVEEDTLPAHWLHCTVQGGEFLMDKSAGEVLLAPHLPSEHDPVSLTPTESRIAVRLLQKPGEIISRRQLATEIDARCPEYVPDTVVNVHVSRLRRRLGEPASISDPSFVSVRGAGIQSTAQVA